MRQHPRQCDAAGGIIDADHGAGPSPGAEMEEEGAVAAADVEDGGGRFGAGEGREERFEVLGDFGGGVAFAEPGGAGVGGESGVSGEIVGVGCVPAGG